MGHFQISNFQKIKKMTEITFKTPIKKNNESPFPHPNTDSKFLQNKVSKTKRFSQPEGKEKKNNWVLESPFCRLLNDSETQPPEKYQVLGNKSISTVNKFDFFIIFIVFLDKRKGN